MNKVKLSFAALLAGVSIAAAEDIPVINAGGTKISLYGFLQLNAIYEDGTNGNKSWSDTAPPEAEDGEGRFMLNVNQTRIGLNLAGPQTEGKPEISGKFESDFSGVTDRNFNGSINGFRIRHSYGQIKFKDMGLTILMGQTWDLIAPVIPPTLSQGVLQKVGSIGNRRPQIRLTQELGPVEIAVAATDDRANQPVMPAFQGSIKTKIPAVWASEKQNAEFTLSGHYATEESALDKKLTTNQKRQKYPASWSGIASLALPVVSMASLSGELFYGQDLARYNGTIGIAAPDSTKDGYQSMGGWGALTVKLPADFSLAGGVGIEALDENRMAKSTETTFNPSKNMIIFGNLKYNIAESAFLGLEYANIATDYASRANGEKIDSGSLNRVELVFNYAFK